MKFYFSHLGVSIPKTLNNDLNNWVQKYLHFNGLIFLYNKESGYGWQEQIIYIGKKDKPTHNDFRQFLHEYGCDVNATNSVLTFLHELGHCLTDSNYDILDQLIFKFQKESVCNAFDYWHILDEFEANMFVVNFMNNNPEAVKELEMIFEGWM